MQSETGLDTHSVEVPPMFTNDDITTTSRFSQQYDTFSTMDYREVIAQGFDDLFGSAFDEIYTYFSVDPASPARNQGESPSSGWPDVVTVSDGQPDIGALEY
jgi:hypothetical protein